MIREGAPIVRRGGDSPIIRARDLAEALLGKPAAALAQPEPATAANDTVSLPAALAEPEPATTANDMA